MTLARNTFSASATHQTHPEVPVAVRACYHFSITPRNESCSPRQVTRFPEMLVVTGTRQRRWTSQVSASGVTAVLTRIEVIIRLRRIAIRDRDLAVTQPLSPDHFRHE